MPEEINRTTKNKKVKLPSGQTVLVPVITKISFIDPVKQYQEYQYTVDNSSGSDRDVHVDTVTSSAGSGTLDVERIDVWKVIDAIKQYQESQFKFDNVTGAHDTPIHFATHAKTHKVKWGDSSAWIQSELIDRFSIIDPIQQYQEHEFTLTGNPDADDNGFATTQPDSGDPDVTDTGTVDPPWRTDPFQNIVDFSDTSIKFTVDYSISMYGPQTSAASCPIPDSPQPSHAVASETQQVSLSFVGGGNSDFTFNGHPVHVSGLPPLPGTIATPNFLAFGAISPSSPSVGDTEGGHIGLKVTMSGLSADLETMLFASEGSFCSNTHTTTYFSDSSPTSAGSAGSLNFAEMSLTYLGQTYLATHVTLAKFSAIGTSQYVFSIVLTAGTA
jgi:hypothetical protein